MRTVVLLVVGFLVGLLVMAGAVEHAKELRDVTKSAQSCLSALPADLSPLSEDCPDCQRLSRQLLWSLEHEPALWDSDGFNLVRCSGANIWVANQDYGLAIGLNRYGGFNPGEADRKALYRGYSRWLARKVGER